MVAKTTASYIANEPFCGLESRQTWVLDNVGINKTDEEP